MRASGSARPREGCSPEPLGGAATVSEHQAFAASLSQLRKAARGPSAVACVNTGRRGERFTKPPPTGPFQVQGTAEGERPPWGSLLPFAFLNNSTASGFSASNFCATSMRDTKIFRSSVWNCRERKRCPTQLLGSEMTCPVLKFQICESRDVQITEENRNGVSQEGGKERLWLVQSDTASRR